MVFFVAASVAVHIQYNITYEHAYICFVCMYKVIYACKHILNTAFGCLVGNVIDTKGKQIIYCSEAAADSAELMQRKNILHFGETN